MGTDLTAKILPAVQLTFDPHKVSIELENPNDRDTRVDASFYSSHFDFEKVISVFEMYIRVD